MIVSSGATGPSSWASPDDVPTVGQAALTVRPVAGALGATVTGLDLAEVSEVAELDELRRALADHLVVFLPEQHLDLDQLERVTDLLGGATSRRSWILWRTGPT